MAATVDWLKWTPHPEVWVLIATVIGFAIYVVRVIEPKVVQAGEPAVTAAQKRWFVLGVSLLWIASDWPLHDIGENYLYWMHMIQHLVITFVVPPVMMLATPAWLFRLMLGTGRFQRWFASMSKPLVAAVIYNILVILTHWSAVVRLTVTNGPVHYSLHLVLFASAILAWSPVCAPAPEYRCSPPAGMIHLFLMSIIPTIPGGWLANAEGVVYPVYDRQPRMWGFSVTEDQQVAGVIMKVMGGFYLWVIITTLFFRWANKELRKNDEGKYRGKLVSVPDVAPDDLATPRR